VALTIFVRIALGTLLERYGPITLQCGLMLFGAFRVAISAAIPHDDMLCWATFVTNQFWCSLMFAPNVVGTANATAAGWGNLDGGVTQIFIVWCLFKPFQAMGMSADIAWRVAMIVPAVFSC
jgi:NNP family nitrate/nitrite transporter-like MFS transporter